MATIEIKIGNGKFEQGEVRFDIDTKDLAKALQQADKLTVAQQRDIAKQSGVVIEPFDRRLLRPVVLGIVQSAWLKAVKGAIPAGVLEAQAKRVANYNKQLEDLKNVCTDDLVATRSRKVSTKAPSEKSYSQYTLVADKKADYEKLMGQQYVIVKAILAIEAANKKPGATIEQMAAFEATLVESKSELLRAVKFPGRTNISFYMNAWKKEGLVTVVNAPPVKEDAKPKPTAAKPAAKK